MQMHELQLRTVQKEQPFKSCKDFLFLLFGEKYTRNENSVYLSLSQLYVLLYEK